MSNFSPKLQDATDNQLMYMVNELNPTFAALASDELTRRTFNKLQETIKVFNDQSFKQTERLVRLTWWIVGLTVVLVIGLTVQIYLAL